INRECKPDSIAGDVGYKAPGWKLHGSRRVGNYADGAAGYSQCFACFADDINKDGWMDVIIIGFPGQPCHWYENPKGESGHWKAHQIGKSACNETPQYADLFGDGKR